MSESVCRYCGERIVLVNFSLGPGWVHQPEGSSFQDGTHVYCTVTRAAAPEELKPNPLTMHGSHHRRLL